MEDVIIDPYTGLELKSKIVNILPMRMNHDKKHTAAKLRDQVIENAGSRTGPDGVIQLFPDKAGANNQWFMPTGLGVNPITDGKYYKLNKFNATYNNLYNRNGQITQFDIYPSGNLGIENKTRLSWNTNPKPENLGAEKGLRNHEITAFIKFGKIIEGATHQSCIFRLQGRDEPVIEIRY